VRRDEGAMRSWVKSIGAYLAGLKGLKEALYAGFEAVLRCEAHCRLCQ